MIRMTPITRSYDTMPKLSYLIPAIYLTLVLSKKLEKRE